MDFMKLLKSLEELLYELVSWLVFYPVTFRRMLSRPLQMMRYADLELGDRPEDQDEDTLSPPFYSQYYVAAPFVMVATLGLDTLLLKTNQWQAWGLAAILLATLCYAQAQIRWFMRDLGLGPLRATTLVVAALLIAVIVTLLLTIAIGLGLGQGKP